MARWLPFAIAFIGSGGVAYLDARRVFRKSPDVARDCWFWFLSVFVIFGLGGLVFYVLTSAIKRPLHVTYAGTEPPGWSADVTAALAAVALFQAFRIKVPGLRAPRFQGRPGTIAAMQQSSLYTVILGELMIEIYKLKIKRLGDNIEGHRMVERGLSSAFKLPQLMDELESLANEHPDGDETMAWARELPKNRNFSEAQARKMIVRRMIKLNFEHAKELARGAAAEIIAAGGA